MFNFFFHFYRITRGAKTRHRADILFLFLFFRPAFLFLLFPPPRLKNNNKQIKSNPEFFLLPVRRRAREQKKKKKQHCAHNDTQPHTLTQCFLHVFQIVCARVFLSVFTISLFAGQLLLFVRHDQIQIRDVDRGEREKCV